MQKGTDEHVCQVKRGIPGTQMDLQCCQLPHGQLANCFTSTLRGSSVGLCLFRNQLMSSGMNIHGLNPERFKQRGKNKLPQVRISYPPAWCRAGGSPRSAAPSPPAGRSLAAPPAARPGELCPGTASGSQGRVACPTAGTPPCPQGPPAHRDPLPTGTPCPQGPTGLVAVFCLRVLP